MRCIFDLFVKGKQVAQLQLFQKMDKDGAYESIKEMRLRILREINDTKSEFVNVIRRVDLENKLVDSDH